MRRDRDCHGVEGSMGDDNPIVLQTAFFGHEQAWLPSSGR